MSDLSAATAALVDATGQIIGTKAELLAWAVGSVGGGPNANGEYPFTAADGTTVLIPCVAKLEILHGDPAAAIAQLQALVDAAGAARTGAETAAELAATNAAGAVATQIDLARRWAQQATGDVDPTAHPGERSAYYYSLTALTAKTAAETARDVAASTVVTVQGLIGSVNFGALPAESGVAFGVSDPVTKVSPFYVGIDGITHILGGLDLSAGAISKAALGADVTGLLLVALAPETGYAFAVMNPVTGVSPFRITLAGVVEADGLVPGTATITVPSLAKDAVRQVVPQVADVVPVRPDIWRQRAGDIAVETAIGDGSRFVAFPDVPCRLLRGSNQSGTAIDVRRSAGLQILGQSYAGGFSPGAWPSIVSLGLISFTPGAYVSPATTGRTAGDYYVITNGASTFNGTAVNQGDLIVYGSDGAWHIQSCPGTSSTAFQIQKSFWSITATGWFDGQQYAVGDRIMHIVIQTGGGGPNYSRWYKGDQTNLNRNDLWYRGEFVPAAGFPASPVQGDVWQASAAGTPAGGEAYAIGDYAEYKDGGWRRIANDPFVTYAAGASLTLRCGSAIEWEVRRADKAGGTGRAAIRLDVQLQSIPKRARDEIKLLSDSLYGTGGAPGAAILAALPGRTGSYVSVGGSVSRQVLGMLEYAIATGDLDGAKTLLAWHTQNNYPTFSNPADLNVAQAIETSFRMQELAGARDIKLVFQTLTGQRFHTWNGTRIVSTNQEEQRAGTGNLSRLHQFYARAFPGRFVNTLDAMLAAASPTLLDPTFPVDALTPGSGFLTEQQVAAKYGIYPWSHQLGATLPIANAAMVYAGTHATAGLPTGGSANDVRIRIGGGATGNILVNVAGAWQEIAPDITHYSSPAATAIASGGPGSALGAGYTKVPAHPGVAGFLLANNL